MAQGKILLHDENNIKAWIVDKGGYRGRYLLIEAKHWRSRSGEFTCEHLLFHAYSANVSTDGLAYPSGPARFLQNGIEVPRNGNAHSGSYVLGSQAFAEEVGAPLARLLFTERNVLLVQAAREQREAELAQAKMEKHLQAAQIFGDRAFRL